MGAAPIGGRYELRERIGAGGMGAVYRATDTRDGTDVAVKVIRPEVSSETGAERFKREAQHTASVRHPNVVEVLDSGVSPEGELYLVMELLDGMSLEERLEILPPPTLEEVVGWLAEALDGLAVVHEAGIIHRDLKPGNLFLARLGNKTVVKVLDFGLARSITQDADGKPLPSLTQTHQFLGTPYYMSPEQVRSAKHIDHRADLFSVGVILYEAIAGRRPFEGPSASAVIASIVADEPIDLGELRPDVPRPLVDVVRRALSRLPDDRFADASEMRRALMASVAGGESLRVTPRDVSATAPTAFDDSPRRPPLATPVTKRKSSSLRFGGMITLFAALVLAAGAAAFFMWPPPSGDPVDAGLTVVPLDGGDAANEVVGGMHRIAGPDDLPQLAARFRNVPEGPTREGVRFIEEAGEGGWIAISLAYVSASAARTMAARMGSAAIDWDGSIEYALAPEIYRTSVSLNVRSAPDPRAELIRTLPRGTVVVGLTGHVEGQESKLGASGSWMYVIPSQHHLGWSASRFLERDSGCLPETEQVVSDLSATDPQAFYGDTVLARLRLRRDGLGQDGFLGVSRDPGHSRSIVGVFRRDAGCALTPELVVPISGWVVDVLTTETEDTGGDTLVFIAWQQGPAPHREGLETWTGYRVGHDRPIFEATVPSSQELPRGRRASFAVRLQHDAEGEAGYFPIRIRHADGRREFFQWDGEAGRLVVVDDAAAGDGDAEDDAPAEGG